MATTSPTTAKPAASDRKLQLKELLDWLIEDGHIDAQVAAKVQQEARARPGRHPIVNVAEAKLRSKKLPSLRYTRCTTEDISVPTGWEPRISNAPTPRLCTNPSKRSSRCVVPSGWA